MQEIVSYKVTWRAADDTGMLHLAMKDGTAVSIPVDSPSEMSLLIDLVRNESPVFYNAKHGLLCTGMEAVGEGEKAAE